MSRFDGRTEKPTAKRKRKAREQGTLARSQEISLALSLVGAVVWARMMLPGVVRTLSQGMRTLFTVSGTVPQGKVVSAVALHMLTGALLPVVALVTTLALAGGVAQSGFAFVPALAKPKADRLNPRQALQRFKPSLMAWEGTRNAVKLTILGAMAWGPIQRMVSDRQGSRPLGVWLSLTALAAWQLVLRMALLAVVIAGADYAWNRFRTMRSLRMTRHELKEEFKQAEGDPLIRSQRRRRHLEMSRNRMIRDVADADVLIVNPLRIAVALKYAPGQPAPKVVAKGMGRFAAQLRKLAYRHGVLVTQDKPLAWALYRRCKVGQYVPSALYEAVAVVLAVAYRRRRAGVM